MSKIYISCRAHPAMLAFLREAGHMLVLCGGSGENNVSSEDVCEPALPVDPAICGHPDLLHCSLGPGMPVFHGDASRLGPRYPADVAYNACCTGKYFIHNLKYTDPDLLRLAKSIGLTLIDVPQGYARCSCLPVDGNAVITADQGIIGPCRRAGLQVLEAGPGFVRLPGYPYGFLGGAAGRIGNTILFHGSLSSHPDGPRIRAFIEARNLTCMDFSDLARMSRTDPADPSTDLPDPLTIPPGPSTDPVDPVTDPPGPLDLPHLPDPHPRAQMSPAEAGYAGFPLTDIGSIIEEP